MISPRLSGALLVALVLLFTLMRSASAKEPAARFGGDDPNDAMIMPVLPNLMINDVSQVEGNGGTTVFNFVVSLSFAAGVGGVTFDIATADNSAATSDSDYVARSLTGQSISAGNATYSFSVTVNGDLILEANETFLVNITNVTGAIVVDGQGTGTILNDEAPLSADLSVSLAVSAAEVVLNDTLIYQISAANVGTGAAMLVVVSDVLPEHTVFVSLSSPVGWTCATPAVGAVGTVQCNINSLPVGGSEMFNLEVKVTASVSAGGNLSNTVNISSASTDSNPDNDSDTELTAVGWAATHTVLEVDVLRLGLMEAWSFSAEVGSDAGVPEGSVTFWDGTHELGTVSLAGGAAQLNGVSLASGEHLITAQYNRGSHYDGSLSIEQSVMAYAHLVLPLIWR